MFQVFLAAAAIGGTLATGITTATAATVAFTSESAVERALRHNPDLLAARLAIAEAEGRLLHAGRLANPEVEAAVMPNMEGREFSAGLGVVQKVPLARRLRLEKAVSQADLEVVKLEVGAAEREVAFKVRLLVVRLLDGQARREFQRRRVVHGQEMLAVAARAAAAGEGSALAAAELELEAGQLEAGRLQIEAQETAWLGELRPLLGLSPAVPLSVTGSLPEPAWPGVSDEPDVDQLARYRVARARTEAARRNLSLQQASRWEDVSVGLGYEREHGEDAGYGLRRENIIGLKLSVPLPLGKNNLSHVREAEALARRREAEADAVAAGMRAEAAAARAEMAAAVRVHEQASGALLGKARQLEERYWAAYRAGQASLTDVIRSREKRLALEASALEARRDYHLARVRFEAATGR